MSQYYSYINIRDPLYGFIGISRKEEKVIQTPLFQRLRRIKQLSNTYLVYPSATHTRFEHSLGTLYLAGVVADKLKFTKENKRCLRLAALIHDIGHGPYSHVFEYSMKKINGDKFSHEDITLFCIENDQKISAALGTDKNRVIDIFKNKTCLEHRIISSVFDIDKMDYFRRDSYHTGVDYGVYDFHRIILCLCKISRFGEEYLGIKEKGMRAVESFRLARFNLWDQVYEHHTRLVADHMLLKAIDYAFNEKCLDKNNFKMSPSKADEFCNYYATLDDYSLQSKLLNTGGVADKIIKRLRTRNLLKRAYRVQIDKSGIPDPTNRRRIINTIVEDVEKKISERAKIGMDELIIYIQNFPIKGYITGVETPQPEEEILVLLKNGNIRAIDSISPLTVQFKAIRRLYVFCRQTSQCINKVKKLCEEEFDAKSDL